MDKFVVIYLCYKWLEKILITLQNNCMILDASGTVHLCKIQNDDFQNPQGIEVLKKYMK